MMVMAKRRGEEEKWGKRSSSCRRLKCFLSLDSIHFELVYSFEKYDKNNNKCVVVVVVITVITTNCKTRTTVTRRIQEKLHYMKNGKDVYLLEHEQVHQ